MGVGVGVCLSLLVGEGRHSMITMSQVHNSHSTLDPSNNGHTPPTVPHRISKLNHLALLT